MSRKFDSTIVVIGIDIGKNSWRFVSARERLVSRRTGIINHIRAFLLERGIAVCQGLRFLRCELPRILATPPDVLSPRMVRIIEDLACDWRRLDGRVERYRMRLKRSRARMPVASG